MTSRVLIGATLCLLAWTLYYQTRTLFFWDQLEGMAIQMPRSFIMFTNIPFASLALGGMSVFALESLESSSLLSLSDSESIPRFLASTRLLVPFC